MLWLGAVLQAHAAERHSGQFVEPCTTPTPNCVSSRDRIDQNYIRPLSFEGPDDLAWQDLQRALLEEPRTEIVVDGRYKLHVEATSLVFRFIDDMTFELIPGEGIIEVRSASRIGYWDFGVNRRRVERIRERFTALMARH